MKPYGGEERRRHKRVPLTLKGRYMPESVHGEYACQTVDVSASGLLVRGFPGGDIGEWVVAYLEELGRVEGHIIRGADTWFAFEIGATAQKLLRLATKIESLEQLVLAAEVQGT
jgi:hypothetical protein